MVEPVEALTSAQRSKIRRLAQPHEHDPSEAGGELNIVPFLDIVTNVLMFVLATIPAVFTVTIETNPPSAGGGGKPNPQPKNALNLSLIIVRDGVSLKAGGGNVAPGCEGVGPGISIPAKGGEHDFAALKACAKKLKDASPDFKEETNVTVIADMSIDYQTVVKTLDAVRETDEQPPQPLFPDVTFGVIK